MSVHPLPKRPPVDAEHEPLDARVAAYLQGCKRPWGEGERLLHALREVTLELKDQLYETTRKMVEARILGGRDPDTGERR